MSFICIILMFMIDWIMALITLTIIAILYAFVVYRKPGTGNTRNSRARPVA
jgi:ABC-type bacteriocin/lantibiotic exporter with double-glycine peptidase domain